MKKILLVATLSLLFFLALDYAYQHYASCHLPITYSLDEIDRRFELPVEAALASIQAAEAVWETGLATNVFEYVESGGELTISFLYDERQQFAEAEEAYREKLDEVEAVSERVGQTYAEMSAEYNALEDEYQSRVRSYEKRLDAFNEEVTKYNERGGAPEPVYQSLEKERQALDQEVVEINALARELNALADDINELGEKGNSLIERYNENVRTYNDTFGEEREFTQGDYMARHISIYKFSDQQELETVLAHELGHAIGIDHVEGEQSVMYYLMGEQPNPLELSTTDQAAFVSACQEKRSWFDFLLTN